MYLLKIIFKNPKPTQQQKTPLNKSFSGLSKGVEQLLNK